MTPLTQSARYIGWNLRMPWWLFWTFLMSFTWFYIVRRVISWDLWWHMAAGRYLLEHGSYPSNDTFTFSPVNDTDFLKGTWLGDIIFYGIYKVGGFYGLQIFRGLCILTPVLLMLQLTKWRYNIWTLLGAGLMIIGTMQKHLIKNAIIIMPAMSFISWAWIQIRFNGQKKWLWAFPPLYFFWSSFHGSAIYGIVFLGLLLAGEFIDSFVIPFLGKISWKSIQWAFQDSRVIATVCIGIVLLYAVPVLAIGLAILFLAAASLHKTFRPYFENAEKRKQSPKFFLTVAMVTCLCAVPVHLSWTLPFHTVTSIASRALGLDAKATSSSSSASNKGAQAQTAEAPKDLKARLKNVFRVIFTGTDAKLVAEYQWPFDILYVLSVKAIFLLAVFYAIYILLLTTLGWRHLSFSLELPCLALLYVAMGYLRTVSYPFVVALPFMAYGMALGFGHQDAKSRRLPGIILLSLCGVLFVLHFGVPIYQEFNRLFFNALGYAKYLGVPFMFLPLVLGGIFLLKEESLYKKALQGLTISLGTYTLGCLLYFAHYENKIYKEGNFHNVSGFLDTEPGLGKSNKFFDGMANYVLENLPPKNIYNSYNMGGYLQWMWYGQRKVFIDGRSIIFDGDFYKAYTTNNAQAYIEKEGFDHAYLNMLVDKDRLMLFFKQGWTPIAYDPGMAILQRPKHNIQDSYGVLPTYQEGERPIADLENLDRQALGGFINMTVHHMMLYGRIKDATAFMNQALPIIEQLKEPQLISQLKGRKDHVDRIAAAVGQVNHPILGQLCQKLFKNVQGFDLHIAMGDAYRALRKWPQAEAEYGRAYQLKKDNKDHLLHFGEVLYMQQKHDRALVAYQEALKLDQNDPRLHNAAVMPLIATNQLDKALMAGHNAIKLNPKFVEAYVNISTVHDKKGELPQAIQALKQALQLQPNQPQIEAMLKRLEAKQTNPAQP